MHFDEETDVVVIGTGASGCATALAAARSGLEVMQLEKAMVLGGTTTHSYGFLWVPGWRNDGDSDVDDAIRYLRFLGAGGVSEDEAREYCVQVLEAMHFLERNGVEFQSLEVPDHHYPSAPGSRGDGRIITTALFDARQLGDLHGALSAAKYVPCGLTWTEVAARGGLSSPDAWDASQWPEGRSEGDYRGFGMGLAGFLIRSVIASGVKPRLGHEVTRLLVDNGRVNGCEVVVSMDGAGSTRTISIAARRAVVIATGGIEGDADLVMRFEDLPDWETHFAESVTGDGMVMATDVGAGPRANRNDCRQKMGYRIPAYEGMEPGFRSAGLREMAAPHTVVVNRRGRRFADESRFQHVANAVKEHDHELLERRNYPCYLVMDSAFFKNDSFAGRPPGAEPPTWLTQADDLGTLADKLGIDAQGLVEEVDEFNASAREGIDPRFDRGSAPFSRLLGRSTPVANPNLGPLETPPYYGVPLVPTGYASTALATDSIGRVLTLRNRPIEGLYACGAAAPTIDRGPAYQAGLGLGQGIATGCRIGWSLA